MGSSSSHIVIGSRTIEVELEPQVMFPLKNFEGGVGTASICFLIGHSGGGRSDRVGPGVLGCNRVLI